MSDEPPKRNGMWALGAQIVTALPPSFIMLVLLNVAFLAVVLRFESHSLDAKLAILNRVLDACLADKLHGG